MKYKWSDQALYLANRLNLTSEQMEGCEKWLEENVFIVGDAWVMSWLHANNPKKNESKK